MRREALRFAIAGAVGFLVDIGVLYIALALGLGFYFGRVISFLSAVWATWQLNRRFTFRAASTSRAWREWLHYLLAMLGGGTVNYACYSAIIHFSDVRPLLPLIAVAIGSIAGMVVNFIAAKYWVFRRIR